MDLLTTVATRAALQLFLEGDGLPAALSRMNLKSQIAKLSAIKRANDKRAAFWSVVSQLESEYNEAYLEMERRAASRIRRWDAGQFLNIETISKNLICIIAICYKSLGELNYMEDALKRWNCLPDVEFDFIDLALAVTSIGPVYALLLRNTRAIERFIIDDKFERFSDSLRVMPAFDFESLFRDN